MPEDNTIVFEGFTHQEGHGGCGGFGDDVWL